MNFQDILESVAKVHLVFIEFWARNADQSLAASPSLRKSFPENVGQYGILFCHYNDIVIVMAK